jgi:hypothetical protein
VGKCGGEWVRKYRMTKINKCVGVYVR